MPLILFLVIFGGLLDPSYAFGFSRPAWVVPTQRGKYGANMIWNIGDVETVNFDCPWPEYKIELWQQSLVANGAIVAKKPVYQQSLGQVLPQQFDWTVTMNDFDLEDSPVFFFWLKEVGDANNTAAQTSAFFNVTEKSVKASPTPVLPSSTVSVPTSSTPSNVAIASPTAPDEQVPASTQGQKSPEQTSGGLTTGATAGIAAAVGVIAIAVTSCVILLFLKRRKRTKQHRWSEQQPPSSYYPTQYGTPNAAYPYEPSKQHPQLVAAPTVSEFPDHVTFTSELPADSRHPVGPQFVNTERS